MTGQVNVGVTATGYVFHESNIAGSKHLLGAVAGSNLDFAGKMNDRDIGSWRVYPILDCTLAQMLDGRFSSAN